MGGRRVLRFFVLSSLSGFHENIPQWIGFSCVQKKTGKEEEHRGSRFPSASVGGFISSATSIVSLQSYS